MEVFTDGSHSRKPIMSGVGVIILHGDSEYPVGAFTSKCMDNNVAEVAAIAFAIKFIQNNKVLRNSPDKTITFFTDSAYAVRKLRQYSPGRDDIEQQMLDYIHHFFETSKRKINVFQIKGHVHDGTKLSFYNNIADDIASEQRLIGLERLYRRLNNHSFKKGKFNRGR